MKILKLIFENEEMGLLSIIANFASAWKTDPSDGELSQEELSALENLRAMSNPSGQENSQGRKFRAELKPNKIDNKGQAHEITSDKERGDRE